MKDTRNSNQTSQQEVSFVQEILDTIDAEGEYRVYGVRPEGGSMADIQYRLYCWLWTAASWLCQELPFKEGSDGERFSVWAQLQKNFPAPLEFMRLASAAEHPASVLAVDAFIQAFVCCFNVLDHGIHIETVTFDADAEDERIAGKTCILRVTRAPR